MSRGMHKISSALAVLSLITLSISPAVAKPPLQAGGFAHAAFQRVWERTDKPVKDGTVKRTWLWGPQSNTGGLNEPNKELPGGQRQVQYFDKSRMEINNPAGNPNDQFFVTNGLLTVELVSGLMQTGATTFQERYPACINVTGDLGDKTAPTYASMQRVSNTGMGDHPEASKVGQQVTATINSSGDVGNDASKSSVAAGKVAAYDDVTKHNIPEAFWTFLNSSGQVYVGGSMTNARLSDPWFYASGRPISEAYWAKATIAGKASRGDGAALRAARPHIRREQP